MPEDTKRAGCGQPSFQNRIRLIASDFDGTLVPLGKAVIQGIDPEVKALLERISQTIPIIIATGRHPSFIQKIAPDLATDTIIGFSGNLIWQGKTQRSTCFSAELAAAVLAFCQTETIPIELFLVDVDNEFYFADPSGPTARSKRAALKRIADIRAVSPLSIRELLQASPWPPIARIVLKAETWPEALTRRFEARFADFCLIQTGRHQREVLFRGINKATQIAVIAKQRGISEQEIAVIGDSDNDLAMLRRYPNSFLIDRNDPHMYGAAAWQVKDCHEALTLILKGNLC